MNCLNKFKVFLFINVLWMNLFILSCKQDQLMPQLDKNQVDKNYDDNAPKTTVGIDEVVKFNFSGNEVRAITLDQTTETDSKNRMYQRPQLKWKVGDKYRFYATIRYVNANDQNDWKPNFSNDGLYIEVTKVSPDGRNGEFRIRGNMQIKDEYIDKTNPKSPNLKPSPEKWYIGGFIGGKLDPTGKIIEDDLGVVATKEGSGVKGIKMKDRKFVAVDPEAKSFNMNVPLGVPLGSVSLKDYGGKIYINVPKDKPLKIRPLGTIFCVQLKNGLAHSVAIPQGGTVKLNSRFLTEKPLQFDLWHYKAELLKAGTSDFSLHYAYENDQAPVTKNGGRTEASIPVDWSQYTKNRYGNDVVLDMDESVNLYLWSVWNGTYNSDNTYDNSINIDFSALGLKTPMYSKYDSFGGFEAMNSAKVTYYGGANSTTKNIWRDMYTNKSVDFLSTTINSSKKDINKSSTIFSQFTISSELLITEVYFDWRSNNNGIIEIFNPNSTAVDLSKYYLMRMDYSDGTCRFVGPFGSRTDRLQCALLMPLDLRNQTEFTPGTTNKSNIYYLNMSSQTEMADRGNPYKSAALLYAPDDQPLYAMISHIARGMTMCIGGHGVYEFAKSGNDRIHHNNRGLYGTGILGTIKEVLKSYIVTDFNTTPQCFGYVYGVVDGDIDKKINASSDDNESGVMARNASQGWALVKEIDGKYYIIDSFGPTWLRSATGVTTSSFVETMNKYKDLYKNNFDMIRRDKIVFPNGGNFVDTSDWDCKNDGTWGVSIGARARYDKQNGRTGKNVPYFYVIK